MVAVALAELELLHRLKCRDHFVFANDQGTYQKIFKEETDIPGISHTITLDTALLQRYPDANTNRELPSQPRWRWFARSCFLKGGVPCALLIEADTGYLLLVSHLADSAYEFGLDIYDDLLMSLDVHPDVHKQPHDGMFSFDPNPESINWKVGGISELSLQRRLKGAVAQLASMGPAQANAALAKLNTQEVNLVNGSSIPINVMRQRLDHYAALWSAYTGETNLFVQIWNMWRKKRAWVK